MWAKPTDWKAQIGQTVAHGLPKLKRRSYAGSSLIRWSKSPLLLIRSLLQRVFLIKIPANQARPTAALRVIYHCG
jgi:hypothetical protein